MIASWNPREMPQIEELRRTTQSLAMLDAILERDWEYRYYSFNSRWATNEQLASMRDGEGDSWFCLFTPEGAFLKGFDHESPMAPRAGGGIWPGMFDGLPAVFKPQLAEPAFFCDKTTFCLWRTGDDLEWRRGVRSYPPGDDPDGSARMLSILDGDPTTYQRWAQRCFDRRVDLASVRRVYSFEPLGEGLVRSLNKDVALADLLDDCREIAYPVRVE